MPNATLSLLLRVAWRNVRRNWRHSLAALGTMAVGFVALALFQGYLNELMASQVKLIYARNMIGDILVRRPRSSAHDARINPHRYRMDEADQAFTDQWLHNHQADVLTRVRTLVVHGMASAGGGGARVLLIGYDVAEGAIARRNWKWNAWAGHPLRPSETNGAMLGMGLGAILGCDALEQDDVMDPATGTPRPVERPFRCKTSQLQVTASSAGGRMNALDVEVSGLAVGSIREFDQRMLWAPLPFVRELADTTGLSNYMILLKHPEQAPALRTEMALEARQRGLQLEIMDWKDSETAETLRRGMELLAIYRSLMVVVILIIAGSAVLTTMMKTVRERTREVGTLRSLGYRSWHMLLMFAFEAAMLSILSGVAGLLSATGIIAGINSMHVMYKAGLLAESIPLRVGYSPSTYFWGFVFLGVVAVVAALIAARSVARMRIATALADS